MWAIRSFRLLVIALSAGLLAPAIAGASNTMVTIAGTGSPGWSGDDGPASAATLNQPGGIAQLADGAILVADTVNNVIRRLSPAGIITRVAGNGSTNGFGDGGPALLASLNGPMDVAVAPDGVTFYIADYSGQRVRRVDPDGVITTVAGTGVAGYTADLVPAGSSRLYNPAGLGVAANGDLYIADSANNRVRRVLASGGLVSGASTIQTVAGTGIAGNSGDGGPATSAPINNPYDVLPLADGRVLFSEYYNNQVREVEASGVIRTAIATCDGGGKICGSGGPVARAGVYRPTALTADGAGGYLVADSNNARVVRVDSSGTVTTVIGNGTLCPDGRARCGDGGPAENASIQSVVRGLLVTADGTIYIADSLDNRVRARVPDPVQAGATGADGAAGGAGAAGGSGAAGGAGAAGAAGASGVDGLRGAVGATGVAGAVGVAGGRGGRGVRGAAGPKGPDGARTPLFVTFVTATIRRSTRRDVAVRLFVSAPARLGATVLRRGRVIRRIKITRARAGINTLALGRLRRGSYRLQITATAGPSISVDRASLTVR